MPQPVIGFKFVNKADLEGVDLRCDLLCPVRSQCAGRWEAR